MEEVISAGKSFIKVRIRMAPKQNPEVLLKVLLRNCLRRLPR